MEPIVIILLLFGAFTLGAESTDHTKVETSESVSEPQSSGAERRAGVLTLQACLSEQRPFIYRDLTIPVTPTQMPTLSEHPESGCPDE